MLEIRKTGLGWIKGIQLEGKYEGISEFRKIRYAKLPTGELCCAPPVAVDSWEGILDCTKILDIAMQITNDGHKDQRPVSEEYLYLNIDTAAEPSDKYPVLIWFHGDSLKYGSELTGEIWLKGVQ